MMSQVGIRELKNRLTHCLRRMQKGVEIVVTDRGLLITLLQQIKTGKPDTCEACLAQFATRGKIIPPTGVPSKRLKPPAY